MQRATECDIHLLKAAADTQKRHATSDAGFNQCQCHRVARRIVGFVPRMRLGSEMGWMNVSASPRQQNSVDRLQQRTDIRDLRRARKHHWQRTGDFCNSSKISFADKLRGKPILDEVSVPDYADHGSLHGLALTFPPANPQSRHPVAPRASSRI